MTQCLIGLGSNLGDRESILQLACSQLQDHLDVLRISSWFEYPAVGGPAGQQDFLNGAALAETSKPADQVVQLLHQLEADAGRQRGIRWSARTLDCDLLLYGDQVILQQHLQVPHPRMLTRRFVLEPANQIAGDMIHPQVGWSIRKLFHHLEHAPPLFSVIGSRGKRNRYIAEQLLQATAGQLVETAPFAGSDRQTALEWAQAANDLLPKTDSTLITTFWVWEPWLHHPDWSAPGADLQRDLKLLIITDPIGSEFGQRLASLDPRSRVPTLFLSANLDEAAEDALGAVAAMS